MTIEKKINIENIIIYYANELARTTNQFTLEEEKVLHLIFSQINPYEKNPTKFKINKLDFFNKLELVGDSKYKRYEKIIINLMGKTITRIEKKDTNSKLIGIVIINSEWFYKKPYFEISLNPNFMPYIEQLKEHYTKVDLNTVCAFKSKHSLTLYKFMSSWTDENKKINQRYLTTKELKELFGLSINDYVYKDKFNRADFERYTIKNSINEINNKTNLIVSFKKRKENGKVKKYEFTWTQKEIQVTTKKLKKQVSIFDLEKENQKQQNIIANEFKQMLNEIDKDSRIIFDN